MSERLSSRERLTHRTLPGLLLAALAAAAAGPAMAGGCDMPVEACLAKMVEKAGARGWVGIYMDHEDPGGPWTVVEVIPESPAAAAGLQAGDLLLALDGQRYAKDNEEAVAKVYAAMVPGKTITYTVRRGDRTLQVPVLLAKVPEQVLAQWIGHHVLEAHAKKAAETASTD